MRARGRGALPLLAIGAAALAACGGSGGLRISSDDNNPEALREALSRVRAVEGRPVNSLGRPLAFVVVRDKPKSLVAYDLEGKRELWRVPSEIDSKVVVGRDFVAHLDGPTRIVGREIKSGRAMWSHEVRSGQFIGSAADDSAIYYTVKQSSSRWVLTALDGRTGRERWHVDASGLLGAPAARGGLVFSPFLKQWLAIIDARTGEQLTRVRGEEEEITFVRVVPDNVFFGSTAGVFLLDERAASGKRAQSTYGKAPLPTDFVRVHYDYDAFDPIQAAYSAYDRNRILWRAEGKDGALVFRDHRVVLHHFRFFFGFDAKSGALAWAYSNPRSDVVGSAHLGSTVAFASLMGSLGALDPVTGRRVYAAEIKGPLLGVTFDAEGWNPRETIAGGGETGTAATLGAIATDRDSRFAEAKKFAVASLSRLPGAEVARDLLALIQDEKTPAYLHETAVEVLIARKDPAGLPYLVKGLAARYDYISNSQPLGIGVIAESIAAMRGKELDPALRGGAVEGLLAHLSSPQTASEDLTSIMRALSALGGGAEIAALRTFVLTYRADPTFSTQVGAIGAAIDGLLSGGGPAEYELVAYVARDARTQPAVAEYASHALSRIEKKPDADSGGAGAATAQ